MDGSSKPNKLREARGASIIMALAYFLICATVGAAALGVALAGVSHLRAQKKNEGSYLAVMSAGEGLKAQLEASAGDWSLENGLRLTSAADEADRADYKRDLLTAVSPDPEPSTVKEAFSRLLYQVYLNCIKDDNSWTDLSSKEEKEDLAETLTLSFTLTPSDTETVSVPTAVAEITLTPDYIAMDSGDVQQLQVRLQAAFSLEDEGRQYSMELSAGGVVHYMLEEIIEEEEESSVNEEGETVTSIKTYYSYVSHVSLSWHNSVFSPGLSQTAEGGEP